MRRVVAVLIAGAAAFAAVAVPGSTATTRNVKVGDDYFVRDDASITVTVGRNTRVKWLWRGESPHNVTVSRGPVKFKSTTMTEGSYSKRMTRAGTYRIYCTIHGRQDQSMVLKVR
ncbi:MAG: plastocyanin/azurin family copper-binding protein [Solirubrobacteraceae bacterium]